MARPRRLDGAEDERGIATVVELERADLFDRRLRGRLLLLQILER
jgi:hypothetical protein